MTSKLKRGKTRIIHEECLLLFSWWYIRLLYISVDNLSNINNFIVIFNPNCCFLLLDVSQVGFALLCLRKKCKIIYACDDHKTSRNAIYGPHSLLIEIFNIGLSIAPFCRKEFVLQSNANTTTKVTQRLKHSQSFGFFRHGKGSSVICSHALRLSFRPRVFPLWQETVLWILRVLALYPNAWMSGLSLRLLSLCWLPKYSSSGSWQNRSVSTNSVPSWRRNLVASIAEWAVILMPSCVCQDRNIRFLAFWVKFPGLVSVLSFHSLRYSRKLMRNWNLALKKE